MATNHQEHRDQVALMRWSKYIKLDCGLTAFDLMISFKNESAEKGTKLQISKRINRFKTAGMKTGTPDLIFAYPRNGYPCLFIEMKQEGGKLRPTQQERIDIMRKAGNLVVVAYGANEAIKYVEHYLAGTFTPDLYNDKKVDS